MDQLKISLEGDQKYLTVRQGTALELKPPVVVNIAGDIDTVKSYVAKRYFTPGVSLQTSDEAVTLLTSANLQSIDKDSAVITFDKTNLSISLDVDPADFYGPKIKGTLQISEELKPWNINITATFTREALIKLIRFNRRYFSDAGKYEEILKAYQNLNLTGTTELKRDSDNRGNKDQQFKKTIDSSSIPTVFFLTMPIFKGQPAVKFPVEVCLDSSESAVIFWFESPELKEIWDNTVDRIFDEQKQMFTDFVIINK